jgi:hypothetical protein
MAIRNGASTSDQISHGSGASFDDLSAFTWFCWFKQNTVTTFRTIASKETSSVLGWRLHSPSAGGGGFLRLQVQTSAGQIAYRTNNQAIVANTWHCVAATFDLAGASNEKINIYVGTLTTSLAESTYAAIADFGGTISSAAAGNLLVGQDTSFTSAWQADFAVGMHWNRALTHGELLDQQFYPHVTSGCVLFTHYGYNGTSTQPDWSGTGNAGTVSGGTLADHVPLRGFRRRRSGLYVPYAASVAGAIVARSYGARQAINRASTY